MYLLCTNYVLFNHYVIIMYLLYTIFEYDSKNSLLKHIIEHMSFYSLH